MPPKAREPINKPDFRPDGWERFERAVDAAVKSGPRHKTAKDKPKEDGSTSRPSGKRS